MAEILSKIKLPEGLKVLSASELEQVASEVREIIINAVSQTGGHLSSSLGAVELAVALHAVLESPKDKIIWDVGHQAYAHKILTDRRNVFSTLRQLGGISGFPKREESPHDAFSVGHASTSISAALGMAKARDLKGEDYTVVAVIGDGALSGGLALEGINNVLSLKTNVIIILNENGMSIAPSVGALSDYLTRIRTSSFYKGMKERVERIIKRIPKVGVPLFKSAERLKDRVKHFLIDWRAEVIFEELGFKYLGPIDGHNLPLLMSTIQFAKDLDRPVLIHIITKKGKGYPPAEKDPTKFHSASPFYKETGEVKSVSPIPTYSSVFGQTMAKLAEKSSKIIGISAAMIDGTGLENFTQKFPERSFDVGIAEEHAITFAAGLAAAGFKPVAAIYSTFLQRAYDQIIHDVCLQKLAVVFALDRAGIVGEDGPTHNGVFDIAYLRFIPNLTIMAPKDENELQHMLYTAVNFAGPIALRYPRGSGVGVKLDEELKQLPIGKSEVVYQSPGTRYPLPVTILALGSMVYPAVEAAKILKAEGISSTVVNMRFVKPLDRELIIELAKESQVVVTVEEGVLAGGFGSAICELFESEKISVKIKRIGLPDEFIEQGSQKEIRERYKLSAEGIASEVKKLC